MQTIDLPEKAAFELHSHLYGSLSFEDLYWLHSRKEPRWHIFQESFLRTYGQKPDLDGLFKRTEKSDALLKSYVHYTKQGNFSEFQTAFDFIIALAHVDPEELYEVTRRVISAQSQPYAEYRMFLPIRFSEAEFSERVIAMAEAAHSNNIENNPAEEMKNPIGKIVLSLSREPDVFIQQYSWFRSLQKLESVRNQIPAIDFCGMEEGNPPDVIQPYIEKVRADNREDPNRAVAILYHVGESFEDKTIQSAVRWVYEAAGFSDRLGHAVALGLDPLSFKGKRRQESLSERLKQIDFELEFAGWLSVREKNALYQEKTSLLKDRPETVDFVYDTAAVEHARNLQDAVMAEMKKTNARRKYSPVIESCPTSNQRITGIPSPVLRFLENGMNVVIGSDDPGIFDTDLLTEFKLIRRMGTTDEQILTLVDSSKKFISEKIARH